jgi:hypothetical protein
MLLLLALTGGTCEFRASSQQPVHSNPPEGEPAEPDSGLLIDIRAGKSRARTADSLFRVSTVAAAQTNVGSSTSIASRIPATPSVPSLSPLGITMLTSLLALVGLAARSGAKPHEFANFKKSARKMEVPPGWLRTH